MPPVSLFPLPMALTPLPSYPTWLRQKELALVPPFLLAFQGYSSTPFSPPVSVWRPASLHPSLFVPCLSVPIPFPSPFICPYPSLLPCLSVFVDTQSPTAAGPSSPRGKLTSSCVWDLIEGSLREVLVHGLTRYRQYHSWKKTLHCNFPIRSSICHSAFIVSCFAYKQSTKTLVML